MRLQMIRELLSFLVLFGIVLGAFTTAECEFVDKHRSIAADHEEQMWLTATRTLKPSRGFTDCEESCASVLAECCGISIAAIDNTFNGRNITESHTQVNRILGAYTARGASVLNAAGRHCLRRCFRVLHESAAAEPHYCHVRPRWRPVDLAQS